MKQRQPIHLRFAIIFFLMSALAPLLYVSTAHAVCTTSSYQVTNANDSGAGSLRQGLIDICAGGMITFTASVQPVIDVASELVVTTNVIIVGPGANTLAVSGQAGTRVFQIDPGVDVTISGLTIRDGSLPGFNGGGIRNQGVLTLTNSVVMTNTAATDGGIYNDGVLQIAGSTLSGNVANAPADLSGGGAIANVGQLSVVDSTFDANTVLPNGGVYISGGAAVFNDGTLAATFTATHTVFANNRASSGGALWNLGGTTSVISSTFAGNQAITAPNDANDGGAIDNDGILTIAASTFRENSAALGGAIKNYIGVLSITNSTFVSNTALGQGATGGAIDITGGSLTLQNSTFAGNRATSEIGDVASGALYYFSSGPPPSVKNTILAGSGSSLACDLNGVAFGSSVNNLGE